LTGRGKAVSIMVRDPFGGTNRGNRLGGSNRVSEETFRIRVMVFRDQKSRRDRRRNFLLDPSCAGPSMCYCFDASEESILPEANEL
jgi:hypothetical protein